MRRPTVIVVEDEPLIRLIAVDALEEAGFEVIDFADADAALAFTGEQGDRVSAVFTDVRLPGESDGIELAQRLSAASPHVRVLVTSGRFAQERPAELPDSVQFVSKPWRGRDIVRILTAPAGD